MSLPENSPQKEADMPTIKTAIAPPDALVEKRDIWVFDLDNTLYPAACNLFAQIDEKMTSYIANHFSVDRIEARRIQKQYLSSHGATLRGLMESSGIDPTHFLDAVHDIDFSPLSVDQAMNDAIKALPGRKLVYTNADITYTKKALSRLGMDNLFEDIHDITKADLSPKPCPDAFGGFLRDYDVDPTRAVFFEDSIRNLKPARAAGMGCVWIDANCPWGGLGYDDQIAHVEIPVLSPWLVDFSSHISG